MYTVENILLTAMQLAGRGDKPSPDDLNQALRTMNTVLKDWAATRGVQLWNIFETTQVLTRADLVSNGGLYYRCYRDHIAAADNEPGTGTYWSDYWVEASEDTTAYVWTTGYSYSANQTVDLGPINVEDVLALRVLHEGQFSSVEKVSYMEFKELNRQEADLPLKAWVEKLETSVIIHLWPLNSETGATLFYHTVTRPTEYLDAAGSSGLPDQWVQALYYALAVELGFMYNISMDRLNLLGQKAQLEFNKAFRSNESEVDQCFVKPCY